MPTDCAQDSIDITGCLHCSSMAEEESNLLNSHVKILKQHNEQGYN